VVGVLADLPGPKVRAGQLPADGVLLAEGAVVELHPGESPSSAAELHVDYPTLLEDVAVGDRVVIGDGAISLRVEEVDGRRVLARVLTGGRAQGRPDPLGPRTTCAWRA
jgi:pyruvate kinase